MDYIVIDTCVWLELIRVDTHDKYNRFDELMYWITSGSLKVITCPNLNEEWLRHREKKKNAVTELIKEMRSKDVFSGKSELDEIYTKENVEVVIDQRIAQVDQLLQFNAEIANESDELYLKACKRTLLCMAPNHKKDSYRDTVNYMAVAAHVKFKGYGYCYFTTINKSDFSDPSEPAKIHDQLRPEFEDAGLEYHYFDNEKKRMGGKLFNDTLRKKMPSFKAYLTEKEKVIERKREVDIEADKILRLGETEPDFLNYSQRIDEIMIKAEPDEVDKAILDFLFKRHPAYEKYFLRKVTENGLV